MTVTIDGSAGVTINSGAVLGLTSATVNAGGTNPFPASGGPTAVDFTSIPSWVKRITVMFNGVSTSGTSNLQIQLGTSSGVTSTGYLSYSVRLGTSGISGGANFTTGFGIAAATATYVMSGATIISSLSGNTWTANGFYADSTTAIGMPVAGAVPLAGTLDRVRITTVSPGTDTFDAGTINILYE
jgi:hypothetical protein